MQEIDKTAKDEDTQELIEKWSLIDTASSTEHWNDVAKENGIHIFAFICPLSRYCEERKQSQSLGMIFFEMNINFVAKDDNWNKLSNTNNYILCPDIGKSPDFIEYKRFCNGFASSLF